MRVQKYSCFWFSRRLRLAFPIAGAIVLLLLTCGMPHATEPVPLRVGGNVAGDWHMMHADRERFSQYPAFFQAVRELGLDYLDVNAFVEHVFYDIVETTETARAKLLQIDDMLTSYGLQYTLSSDAGAWIRSLELEPGVNELDHADGTHRLDLRREWVDELLDRGRGRAPALIGMNYDEGEHNQLTGNAYVGSFENPPAESFSYDKPFYASVEGLDLQTAWARLVDALVALRTEHYGGRLRLLDEQVWPDLYTVFARAGWTVCPKLLKEELSSVAMAGALGATLQYAGSGTDLWVSPDLNKYVTYPGWPPRALRSALMMSYWLGASAVHVENIDYDNPAVPRHPEAGAAGSLLAWSDTEHFALTDYGRVVQDFVKSYLPAHPRSIHWRDYRPRVAIVRLPDGDCGQAGSIFNARDRLLGIPDRASDAISREWIEVWKVLTHGAVRGAGLTLFASDYPDRMDVGMFVPIDSVAVFDHTVSGPVLEGIECFIVCGHALSDETFQAIRARVSEGATCLISRRLLALHAMETPPGNWVIVDDFSDPEVAAALAPFLGPADVARFRFAGHIVEFREGTDAFDLQVTVTPRSALANRAWMDVP